MKRKLLHVREGTAVPTLLKHNPCPACGHRHHFCLHDGNAVLGREYTYVCPETGRETTLRLEGTAEVVQFAPAGAVPIAPTGR